MQKIILHTNIKQMGPRTFGPIQRNILPTYSWTENSVTAGCNTCYWHAVLLSLNITYFVRLHDAPSPSLSLSITSFFDITLKLQYVDVIGPFRYLFISYCEDPYQHQKTTCWKTTTTHTNKNNTITNQLISVIGHKLVFYGSSWSEK